MEPMDSIMDMLDRNSGENTLNESNEEALMVPRKCAFCKNNVICSVLPTFIGMSKIGIVVGIEECPYYTPSKTAQSQQE